MYVLVNPFSQGTASGAASGVNTYTRLALPLISNITPVLHLERPQGLGRREYQEYVRDQLSPLCRREADLLVEAPESMASTLLCHGLGEQLHVRCHCPSGLAQYHDGRPIHQRALAEEVETIRRSSYCSAPSERMRQVIQPLIRDRGVRVYPNPPPPLKAERSPKTIDALFLARAQHLKGIDYLREVLAHFPRHLKVVIAGFGCNHIRLGRGIKCDVELRGELSGSDRDVLLSQSKVLLHLSRFESFGMTLVEALAAQTVSVSWPVGIAEQLAEAGISRVIPHGDPLRFAQAVQDTLRLPYPSFDDFRRAHDSITSNFIEGVSATLGKTPVALDNSETEPTLLHLLEGHKLMHSNRSTRSEIWYRKLRKLKRDPVAFLKDSKVVTVVSELVDAKKRPVLPESENVPAISGGSTPPVASNDTVVSVVPASSEPRVIADIYLTADGALQIETWKKKVAEPNLATAIFCPRNALQIIDQPLVGEASRDKQFVGFRDRYLFAVRHDLGAAYQSESELEELFRAGDSTWKSNILPQIRNAVFLNPSNVLLELIRSTCPSVRIIVYLSERPAEFLATLMSPVDVLVTAAEIDGSSVSATRRIEVSTEKDFVGSLRDLIIDHKDKEKNMFVPVYGTARPLPDIDLLVESNADGVLVLRAPLEVVEKARTFQDVATSLCTNVDFVLLREEHFIRYQDLCDGELAPLLLATLRDGCRYEVRS